MTQLNSPQLPVYYVVFVTTIYSSFEEAKTKSPDLIQAHLEHSKQLHGSGSMSMGGIFLDKDEEQLNTMSIHISYQAALEYIQNDPFVQSGMVKTWRIRQWANMFA